jgi:hypothetical protein
VLLTFALVATVAVTPALRCEEVLRGGPGPGPVAHQAPLGDSVLVALFAGGESFDAFLARSEARRAMWLRNWEASRVSDDLLARARAIPGRWRLLVSAVDGCSDSVNTVPYLARLAALVPAIELRIVAPSEGRVFMERHRTPDGRAATPTVVILDAAGNAVGCWVERPAALQDLVIKARAEGRLDAFLGEKQGWYDRDAGVSTVREVIEAIAAASAGAPTCRP